MLPIDELSSISPAEMLLQWPRWHRLVALLSGTSAVGGAAPSDSRWSILAEPDRVISESLPGSLFGGNCLPRPRADAGDEPPFLGGYIGYMGYDFGASMHPKAAGVNRLAGKDAPAADEPGAWPQCQMHRCQAALCHDGLKNRWWVVGQPKFAGPLRDMARAVATAKYRQPTDFAIGPVASAWSQQGYTDGVTRAQEHIARGDVYQMNLTHTLAGSFSGSGRALMAHLHSRSHAWFGAYLESPEFGGMRRIYCGQSPELFLKITPRQDGGWLVQTRPMKGTRPLAADDGQRRTAEAELLASEKENAELTMIVDLMRNDLGRVCSPGTVEVTAPRGIEQHGEPRSGVLQATATVQGVLAPGVSLDALLAATLPGGSITGAPKLRAMQLIDEIEPQRRGPYCGVVGFFSECGRVELAMAIRTALVAGPGPNPTMPRTAPVAGSMVADPVLHCDRLESGRLCFPVGAGIVADSVAQAEWEETLAKAAVLEAGRGGGV